MNLPSSDELNLIRDPEVGLALLAKCPAAKTPEQTREHQFWQLQFTDWRDWLAGDVLAVSRGITDCWLFKQPPPFWLLKAISSLCHGRMSDGEIHDCSTMNTHYQRWKAVKLVRGRHPKDPRNYKDPVQGDAVWAEAAKLVAGTEAEGIPDTMKKSHALIRRGGGARITLPSYKRAIKKRVRPRRHKKKI
jgi:hypothetical protein